MNIPVFPDSLDFQPRFSAKFQTPLIHACLTRLNGAHGRDQGRSVLLEKMQNSHQGIPDYSFNIMGYILSPGLPPLDISEYCSGSM